MQKDYSDKIGELSCNKHGTLMKIIKYNNYNDIDVEFQDEHKYVSKHMRYDYFKNGTLQNPFDITVFGVGYLGENYITKLNNHNFKKSYNTWNGMLERCYDEKYQTKKPTYKGCYVVEEWKNFKNFDQWYNENFYQVDNCVMALDKDIVIKNNKCYSPETCVFVPQMINALFTKSNKLRGSLPIGVTKDHNLYKARLSTLDGRKYLGSFSTPEEAFYCYKEAKEEYIKQIADEYKSKIPQKLYEALYKYRVDISD